jgi:hypothetical protein
MRRRTLRSGLAASCKRWRGADGGAGGEAGLEAVAGRADEETRMRETAPELVT